MKSERRHELEKNELADRLATGIESTKSFMPAVLGGLILVGIAAVVWGVYSSYSKQQASVAWTDFYFNLNAGDPDSFVDLADDYPSSAAAGWARQVAADNYLQRGIADLYRDKKSGQELLGKAIKEFEVVDRTASTPELRAKAALGLAQAHESLGDTDKAAGYYQQVAKSATQPGIIAEANQRLAFLASDSGKEFYAWFKTQDPKPDAPISLPSDMLTPPTSPDLQFGPTDTEANSSPDETASTEVDTSHLPELPAGAAPAEASQTTTPALPAGGEVPTVELESQTPAPSDADDVPPNSLRAEPEDASTTAPATDGPELKP